MRHPAFSPRALSRIVLPPLHGRLARRLYGGRALRAEAAGLLRDTASDGQDDAWRRLGRLLESGWGGTPEPAAAAQAYRRGIAAGNVESGTALAKAIREGKVGPAPGESVRGLLEAAAGDGSASALAALGDLYREEAYRKGEGVAADPVRANAYLLAAAEKGHGAAATRAQEVAAGLSAADRTQARRLAEDLLGGGVS